MEELRRSGEYWSLGGKEKVMCAVPGCGHVGDGITKAHCKVAHNISRDEVTELHGMPYRIIQVNMSNLKEYQFTKRKKNKLKYEGE